MRKLTCSCAVYIQLVVWARRGSINALSCAADPENRKMYFVILLAALLLRLAACQLDCAFPTNDDISEVIGAIIKSADSASDPVITLTSFRPVCLAYSEEKNRYRGVSFLANYSCTSNAECPEGVVVDQFETGCNSAGSWAFPFGNADHARTESPTANSTTVLREDCAHCISQELAANTGASSVDAETHCLRECTYE